MFDVCTTGDTAHINTIFKFLPHTRTNMARTRSTSSSVVNGRPLDSCLHRHPVPVNCLYHARIVLSVGWVLGVLCTKCPLHSNHRLTVWHSNTQKTSPPGTAIFSVHTLASPSGRNVKYDKKNNLLGKWILSCSFYLYRFCKYVSCGFPIIHFCNPGVHYETPCI